MTDYIKDLRRLIGNRPVNLPGASVILFDKSGRVLLQKRTDNGFWGLPGGLMELGETVEETAKRETFEETGLNVIDMRLFGVYSGPDQYYKYPNGDEVFHIDIVFISDRFEGSVQIDGIESEELKFFDLESLPLNINPPDKPILDDIKNEPIHRKS